MFLYVLLSLTALMVEFTILHDEFFGPSLDKPDIKLKQNSEVKSLVPCFVTLISDCRQNAFCWSGRRKRWRGVRVDVVPERDATKSRLLQR